MPLRPRHPFVGGRSRHSSDGAPGPADWTHVGVPLRGGLRPRRFFTCGATAVGSPLSFAIVSRMTAKASCPTARQEQCSMASRYTVHRSLFFGTNWSISIVRVLGAEAQSSAAEKQHRLNFDTQPHWGLQGAAQSELRRQLADRSGDRSSTDPSAERSGSHRGIRFPARLWG